MQCTSVSPYQSVCIVTVQPWCSLYQRISLPAYQRMCSREPAYWDTLHRWSVEDDATRWICTIDINQMLNWVPVYAGFFEEISNSATKTTICLFSAAPRNSAANFQIPRRGTEFRAPRNSVGPAYKASYLHICALHQIRSFFTTEACKTIAVAIVGSQFDYCNSFLAGTSVSYLACLLLVQNTLAFAKFKSFSSIIIIILTSVFFQDQSRVWTAASQQHKVENQPLATLPSNFVIFSDSLMHLFQQLNPLVFHASIMSSSVMTAPV